MLKLNRQAEIPEETIKAAKAAFPMGNMYVSLRDTLGPIYEDGAFQDLYPMLGQPAQKPGVGLEGCSCSKTNQQKTALIIQHPNRFLFLLLVLIFVWLTP